MDKTEKKKKNIKKTKESIVEKPENVSKVKKSNSSKEKKSEKIQKFTKKKTISKKESDKVNKNPIQHYGVGRRKTAVARVYIKEGTGNIKINGVDYNIFYNNYIMSYKILQPVVVLGCEKKYDFKVNVYGGGICSQIEAIRLGMAICLVKIKSENKSVLRNEGFLTTDSRKVERKKFGHKKARKSFQFTKR